MWLKARSLGEVLGKQGSVGSVEVTKNIRVVFWELLYSPHMTLLVVFECHYKRRKPEPCSSLLLA